MYLSDLSRTASVFKDQDCGGVNIEIVNRDRFDSVVNGIEIASALRKLYPNNWEVDKYGRLLVNAEFLGNDKARRLARAAKKGRGRTGGSL